MFGCNDFKDNGNINGWFYRNSYEEYYHEWMDENKRVQMDPFSKKSIDGVTF